ncbi:MAG TPA: hypothetical protein VH985_04165 [Candidatus Binatia bacterium]
MSNWPPRWSWTGGVPHGNPTGEIGVLVEVIPSRIRQDQIHLLVALEGGEYMGSLVFKDAAACQQIFEILKAHRGCPLHDIGGLDISHLL